MIKNLIHKNFLIFLTIYYVTELKLSNHRDKTIENNFKQTIL